MMFRALLLAAAGLVAGCSAGTTAAETATVTDVETVTASTTQTETVTATATQTETAAPPAVALPTMFSCVTDRAARVFQIVPSGDTFVGSVSSIDLIGDGPDAELFSDHHDLHGSVSGDSFEFTIDGNPRSYGTLAAGHVVLNETAPRGDVLSSSCDETSPSRWNQLIRNFNDAVDIAHESGVDGGLGQ